MGPVRCRSLAARCSACRRLRRRGDDAQSGLNVEQQRAVGIVVAHPVAAKAPERIEALGLVLDATALISDMGESSAAAAAEQAASAELARLRALHAGGAGASLKMIEAAQAEQARARAQAQLAAARFHPALGSAGGAAARRAPEIIDASTSGRSLLVRADLPGRHSFGTGVRKAVLDVDGIQVPGRVLGVLRETTELQSVGSADRGAERARRLGCRRAHAARAADGRSQGLAAAAGGAALRRKRRLCLQAIDEEDGRGKDALCGGQGEAGAALRDGWLVEGVDDDDNIVVQGAGVLWSLQGVGAQQHEDDDED